MLCGTRRNLTSITWHTHQNGKWLNTIKKKKRICKANKSTYNQIHKRTHTSGTALLTLTINGKTNAVNTIKKNDKWLWTATVFGENWNKKIKKIQNKPKQNKSHLDRILSFFFFLFKCTFFSVRQWKLVWTINFDFFLNCVCALCFINFFY